jgi:hypothetical protein
MRVVSCRTRDRVERSGDWHCKSVAEGAVRCLENSLGGLGLLRC